MSIAATAVFLLRVSAPYEQGVSGSNPAAPTVKHQVRRGNSRTRVAPSVVCVTMPLVDRSGRCDPSRWPPDRALGGSACDRPAPSPPVFRNPTGEIRRCAASFHGSVSTGVPRLTLPYMRTPRNESALSALPGLQCADLDRGQMDLPGVGARVQGVAVGVHQLRDRRVAACLAGLRYEHRTGVVRGVDA
jgi:hypothetical protein